MKKASSKSSLSKYNRSLKMARSMSVQFKGESTRRNKNSKRKKSIEEKRTPSKKSELQNDKFIKMTGCKEESVDESVVLKQDKFESKVTSRRGLKSMKNSGLIQSGEDFLYYNGVRYIKDTKNEEKIFDQKSLIYEDESVHQSEAKISKRNRSQSQRNMESAKESVNYQLETKENQSTVRQRASMSKVNSVNVLSEQEVEDVYQEKQERRNSFAVFTNRNKPHPKLLREVLMEKRKKSLPRARHTRTSKRRIQNSHKKIYEENLKKEEQKLRKNLFGKRRSSMGRNMKQTGFDEKEVDFYSKYEILTHYDNIIKDLKLPKVNFGFRPKVKHRGKFEVNFLEEILTVIDDILDYRSRLQKEFQKKKVLKKKGETIPQHKILLQTEMFFKNFFIEKYPKSSFPREKVRKEV